MDGYKTNIEEKTLQNEYFRQVLFTAKNLQLVVMSLLPGEEIGIEVHDNVDQFFRVEEGEGKVVMNGTAQNLKDGDVFIVPQGTEHNVINTSMEAPLKIYTIYSPPNHPDGKVHKTLKDAMADEHDHA